MERKAMDPRNPAQYDTTGEALVMIMAERGCQDTQWGVHDWAPPIWATIIGKQYGQFCEAVNETTFDNPGREHLGGYDHMMHELTQVAACAVAAMECLMRMRYGNHEA